MDSASSRALRAWLEERHGVRDTFEVRLIQGGRSNLSYRVDHGDERFVLRRPPFGAVLEGAHDVLREFRLLQSLEGTAVPLARPVAACEGDDVLGANFTLVEFLAGRALRTADDASALSEEARRAVPRSFGAALAQLHQVDPERVGRPRASGLDHAERQLRVWTRQLQAEPSRPLPLLDALGEHLLERRPEQRDVAIVHGDYRLDNVMVGDDGAVIGVLDWELWTVGDPTLDLGNTLAYWTESAYELFALGTSPTAGGTARDTERRPGGVPRCGWSGVRSARTRLGAELRLLALRGHPRGCLPTQPRRRVRRRPVRRLATLRACRTRDGGDRVAAPTEVILGRVA